MKPIITHASTLQGLLEVEKSSQGEREHTIIFFYETKIKKIINFIK